MKKWRCTVCGYIHEGPEPPETCPVCGAPASAFVEVVEEAVKPAVPGAGAAASTAPPVARPSAAPVAPVVKPTDDSKAGIYAMSYGMYVVASKNGDKFNAQAANTVFQVTSEPTRVAIGINKLNQTHDFIEASKVLTVTVLGKGNMKHIKRFGFQSGRNVDKFAGLQFTLSPKVGCPIVPDGVAYLECEVRPEMSVDVGTHTLYVADVVGGGELKSTEPITYAFYRANRAKPEEFVDDVDWNNVIAALNLEYGANRRYQYQIAETKNPRIAGILEGVMRTEADHADSALRYLSGRLEEKLGAATPGARGFLTGLLHMKLNWDFEEVARATYSQFAKETDDPELRKVFTDQARSEMGHVNIFKEIVGSMEKGQYPALFFCPVCGWELDYGVSPAGGSEKACPKCGAKFALSLVGGNWTLTRIS